MFKKLNIDQLTIYRNVIHTFMLSICALMCVQFPHAQHWEPVTGPGTAGGISASNGSVVDADIVVRNNGELFAVWIEETVGVHLKHFNGESWVEYPSGSATGGGITGVNGGNYKMPRIDLNNNQEPIVAHGEDTHVFVRKWDGNTWTGLGGSDSGDGLDEPDTQAHTLRQSLEMAVDSSGYPYVAWVKSTDHHYILMKRWNGSSWVGIGGTETVAGLYPALHNYNSHNAFFVLDSSGNPKMAHRYYQGEFWWSGTLHATFYTEWTGSGWQGLNSSNSGSGISDSDVFIDNMVRGVALNASGQPVVASAVTHSGVGSWNLIQQWNGSAWQDITTSPVMDLDFRVTDMKTDGLGRIVVVGVINGITIQAYRLTGSTWENLGAIPGEGQYSSQTGDGYGVQDIHLDVRPSGEAYVIFSGEVQGVHDIYVYKFVDSDLSGAYTYLHDDINRLTNINTDNGIRISYAHNLAGNREQKEVTSQLLVDLGPDSLQGYAAANNEINTPVIQIALDVNPEEDITLDSLALQASGTGDESSALTDARLWVDADESGTVTGGDMQIGSTLTTFSNDGELMFSSLSHTLSAGSTAHLLVTYTFDGTPSLGDTFLLDLLNRHKIGTVGDTSGNSIYALGAPVLGRVVTITNDFVNPVFSGLDTAVGGSGSVQLDWTAGSDAAGSTPITYRIWQSTSTFGGTVLGLPDYSTTNNTFLVDGMTNGQPYYYVVRAEDSVGNRELNTTERTATPMATTYSLAVASANGIALPLPPTGTYDAGSVVSLNASPDAGYTFTGWSGDVPGGQEMDNPLDLTMDANKSLTASFASAVGTVQVNTTPNSTPVWSFQDSSGTPHAGNGDASFNGTIPTGGLEMSWVPLAGYLTPKSNPTIDALAKDGTVTFTGVYIPELTITAQPQPLKKYVDESASFSVTTTGGDGTPHYIWKFDDGQNPQVAVSGNVSNLQLANLALTQDGTYLCEITDDYPDTKISNAVTLEVGDHLSITQHPLGSQLGAGNSQMFTVATTGGVGVLFYQWKKDGVIIPGATSSSYTIIPLDLDDAGSYNVTISDTHTDVIESNSAILTVQPLPVAVPIAEMLWLFALISLMIPMAIFMLKKNEK